MPARRSHQKSRRGCTTCKKLRVKCDEAGPPCGACKLRATTCDYSETVSPSTIQPSLSKSPASTSPPGGWLSDNPNHFPPGRRLLEMQLMNCWSAVTYKSMATQVAEDGHVWQRKLPEWGLHHDYLLSGLLSLTAFEMASASETNRAAYVDVAHELQDQAVSSFRRELSNISSESFEALLVFSMLLFVLALAAAQFSSTSEDGESRPMVQSTLTHFELLRGCWAVLEGRDNWVEQNPYLSKIMRFEDLPRLPLKRGIEKAIAKLTELNENRITSSVGESHECRLAQISCWKSCKKAIETLQECYSKCMDNVEFQGYVLGWLNMAGDEYIEAIRSDDQPAVLILMFWGVLVQKLSDQAWWARNYGTSLVQEISSREEYATADGLIKDIIALAQKSVQTVD